jgi:hypothetical protein
VRWYRKALFGVLYVCFTHFEDHQMKDMFFACFFDRVAIFLFVCGWGSNILLTVKLNLFCAKPELIAQLCLFIF